MTEKDFRSIDDLAAACRDETDRLADALRFGGEGAVRIEVGAPRAFDPNSSPPGSRGSGAILQVGPADAAFLWLIPRDALPAEWTTLSNVDRDARLRRAATELAGAIFGDARTAEVGEARQVDSLAADRTVSRMNAGAKLLELIVRDAESHDERGRVSVVGPVGLCDEAAADGPHAAEFGSNGAGDDEALVWNEDAARIGLHFAPPSLTMSANTIGDSIDGSDLPAAARRLMRLPVTVVVQLAEKRIEMRQLLSMTVGTLITFDKACEAPLELYVNNRLYCQGEAVKIGEKFGLKIDQVGARTNREERILYG